jgi:hypothetical protein
MISLREKRGIVSKYVVKYKQWDDSANPDDTMKTERNYARW